VNAPTDKSGGFGRLTPSVDGIADSQRYVGELAPLVRKSADAVSDDFSP
jgi:hypothetical protein